MPSDSDSPSQEPRRGGARPAGRRAPVKKVNIPSGPPWKKILPWVLAAAAVGGLVFLIRDPRYVTLGAFLIGLVVMALLGYVASSYRSSLQPEDKLRNLLIPVSVLALAAAAVPYAMVLFPPPPEGSVTLAAVNEAKPITVHSIASTLILNVRGTLSSTASGTGDYFMSVAPAGGGSPERIDGELRPHAGGPLPESHRLGLHGPGTYTVRLEQASPALVMPLTVSLSARPFNTAVLGFLYGLVAILVLTIDTMLWRRGVEPSFAAALLLPLVAVAYFQHRPISPEIQPELRSAGIVGALVGGLGGELLAQLLRRVLPGR